MRFTPRFPKTPWEILKINEKSLIFHENPSKSMKNHGFSRFPNVYWEIWVCQISHGKQGKLSEKQTSGHSLFEKCQSTILLSDDVLQSPICKTDCAPSTTSEYLWTQNIGPSSEAAKQSHIRVRACVYSAHGMNLVTYLVLEYVFVLRFLTLFRNPRLPGKV